MDRRTSRNLGMLAWLGMISAVGLMGGCRGSGAVVGAAAGAAVGQAAGGDTESTVAGAVYGAAAGAAVEEAYRRTSEQGHPQPNP